MRLSLIVLTKHSTATVHPRLASTTKMKRFKPARADGSPAVYRLFLAEFLGMFVFTYVSCSTVASVVRANRRPHTTVTVQPSTFGDSGIIALGSGLGLFLGALLTGGVTTPHLNPAVTLALVLCGDATCCNAPTYLAAQVAGSCLGAAFMFSVHGHGLQALPKSVGKQAFALSILEDDKFNLATLLWEQLWISSLFMVIFLAACDRRKALLRRQVRGDKKMDVIDGEGLLILASSIGLAYGGFFLVAGINAASTINPAKDLFPRVIGYFLGFGSTMNSFLLVPLIMPFVGSALGALIYYSAIGWFWPDVPERDFTQVEERVLDLQEEITDLKDLLLPPPPPEKKDGIMEEPLEPSSFLQKNEPGRTSVAKLFEQS